MTSTTPFPVRRARPRAIPRIDRWPQAVRSAELLRGALARCGPGLRPVGWPETPRVRAAALAPWLAPDRIAIRMSAAWIWGAARDPGAPLEFSTAGRRRPARRVHPDHLLHQFGYAEDAVERLGDFSVTTPEQTVHDLLRLPSGFTARHRVACRLLLQLVPDGRRGVAGRLCAQHAQYRALARERLSGL